MNAYLINIGDELLIGQVVNTNASWIASELEKNNIHVDRIVTIADDLNDIQRHFRTRYHRQTLLF